MPRGHGGGTPLNSTLMDVDDDLISSPRAPTSFSHRATRDSVTPALGLARAALMLCAAFAVSTAYLLVVVHSHAAPRTGSSRMPRASAIWAL